MSSHDARNPFILGLGIAAVVLAAIAGILLAAGSTRATGLQADEASSAALFAATGVFFNWAVLALFSALVVAGATWRSNNSTGRNQTPKL